MKITCVGCGVMGSSIIGSYLKGGNEVTIVDLNEDAAKPLVERGAAYSASLADALDCDFIFLNLPDHAIDFAVLEPVKDQLKGMTVVNSTTLTPNQVIETEKFVVDCGARYLDCVIGCYPAEVGTDAGYLVYSGDPSVFEDCKAAFASLSNEPAYLGENVTASSIIDLAGVAIHYGFVFSLMEGVSLCLKHNYDVKDFIGNLDAIFPALYTAETRQVLADFAPFTGEFSDADEATMDIETHGLAMVEKAMSESGVKTTFSRNMLKTMTEVCEAGYGKKNMVAIITAMIDL